ncbi:MAG: tRNA uridine-5-carboxymethylaminomethyl(34) synthesis GTPase MnmE [Lachnospiraceae bacterium]|nr:tRNA uridine-5-carboxymethylaminomethyl(34) synthesis GTPase MnmE [Lachnospiraceae bacterium]
MNSQMDTIAAVATAMTPSGIGIVRISGQDAVSIADRVYRNKKRKSLEEQKTHTIHYGFIVDRIENEQIIDEVLVMLMRGPHSYTGEDTVEIDCHGGVLAMRKVLEAVVAAGARPAEPGEFTKRAFLNGRIDLSQAEAVMDVISAKNEYALKSSLHQLQGSVMEKIREIREAIIYEIAFIESALDDPEHISIDGYGEKLAVVAEKQVERITQLLSTAKEGKMIQEGIKTVIVGKPNVGKSSLLNLLVGEEKAIVTDIAGTTRDVLEEVINLQGISLRMLDTAGIREASDQVEQIGVERAREHAKDADLILYVVDSSKPLDDNDSQIMELIQDKKAIVLLNKSDLESQVSKEDIRDRVNAPILTISARDKTGITLLEDEIRKMFFSGDISFNDEVYITNVRHKKALEDAREALYQVQKSIELQMPEDFYSIDLTSAYEALGSIIGESMGEDLVNEIFSKFCTGK